MRLIIIGAGGYGQTVSDIAFQSGKYDSILFLDDQKTGSNILGKTTEYMNFIDYNTEFYPAFGNNELRLQFIDNLISKGAAVPILIHQTAYISPRATIETGSVILPKAVVNTDCKIGKGCIINCGAIVDHGCVIENGCHICLGAIVKGENRISKYTKIEAGEIIQLRAFPVEKY